MQTSYICHKILTCISDCVLECSMQFSAHKLIFGHNEGICQCFKANFFDNTANRLFHISNDKIWIILIDLRRNLSSCHMSICKEVGFYLTHLR